MLKILRSFLLFLFSFVLFFGAVGITGMWKTHVLEASGCKTSYRTYFVDPLLKDWWDCREGMKPCGKLSRKGGEKEAQKEMLGCLCEVASDRKPAAEKFLKDSYCARCHSFEKCPECRFPVLTELCMKIKEGGL